jgi:hypothetical protein
MPQRFRLHRSAAGWLISLSASLLAEKLAEIGVTDSAVNIRNKVARGGFSAVFFVQCLRAMGCQTVRLAGD